MTKKLLVLLLATATLTACGEPEETCVCSCTCGSGDKSTLSGASSIKSCASLCEMNCGNDSYTSSYDCKTEGATSETPTSTAPGR